MSLDTLIRAIDLSGEIDLGSHIEDGFFRDFWELTGGNKTKILAQWRRQRDRILKEHGSVLRHDLEKYGVNGKITYLDEIKGKHATGGLGSILGFNVGNSNELKKKLIEYGVFSTDLREYNNKIKEAVCQWNIKNLSNGGVQSEYFKDDIEALGSNRRIFAQSAAFGQYLRELGITHLDEIKFKHATRGLGSILGFNLGNPSRLKEKLIEYGVFSADLEGYSNNDLIISDILKKAMHPTFRSAYFSKDISGDDAVEANRKFLLGSRVFQDYLSKNKISLADLETITGKDRNVFRCLFGEDFPEVIAGRKHQALGRYREIQTEWTPEEEGKLLELFNAHKNAHKDIIKELKGNKETYEEQFGRTVFAILLKMERMGLIHYDNPFSDMPSHRFISYKFPQAHVNEFGKGALFYIKNQALLNDKGVESEYTPVFGYASPVHEQFLHATVPVFYKGRDIEAYNRQEQNLLRVVNAYLTDPYKFTKNKNTIIPPDKIKKDPVILAIEDPEDSSTLYTQILVRARFSKAPEMATTNAISLRERQEIYFFRHGKVSFEDTRR